MIVADIAGLAEGLAAQGFAQYESETASGERFMASEHEKSDAMSVVVRPNASFNRTPGGGGSVTRARPANEIEK